MSVRLALPLIACALATLGCSTPFLDEQNRLFWERQQGRISENEYQARMDAIKAEQPWGGTGGAKQEPPPPLHLGY